MDPIVVGACGFDILFELLEKQLDPNLPPVPINLSGATCTIKAQKQNETVIKFTGSMTVINPLEGTVKYTPILSDFNSPGRYLIQIDCYYSPTKNIPITDIIIDCIAGLPK